MFTWPYVKHSHKRHHGGGTSTSKGGGKKSHRKGGGAKTLADAEGGEQEDEDEEEDEEEEEVGEEGAAEAETEKEGLLPVEEEESEATAEAAGREKVEEEDLDEEKEEKQREEAIPETPEKDGEEEDAAAAKDDAAELKDAAAKQEDAAAKNGDAAEEEEDAAAEEEAERAAAAAKAADSGETAEKEQLMPIPVKAEAAGAHSNGTDQAPHDANGTNGNVGASKAATEDNSRQKAAAAAAHAEAEKAVQKAEPAQAEAKLGDFADAEIRSLLVNDMALSESSPAVVAMEAGVEGGAGALEALIAADAAASGAVGAGHQPAVRAIRAWLLRKSQAAMPSPPPPPLGAGAGAGAGAALMDVDVHVSNGAAGPGAGPGAGAGAGVGTVGPAKKLEEGTAGDVGSRDGGSGGGGSAGGGRGGSGGDRGEGAGDEAGGVAPAATLIASTPQPGAALEPPAHAEHMHEHTRRVLALEPGDMPKKPDALDLAGGGDGPLGGKPPKCAVCVIHKKGICGTASAPNKCHRRRHLFTPQALSGPDAPPTMEQELAKVAAASDLLGLAPDDEVVGELLQAQAALARTVWITRTLAAKALAGAAAAAAAEAAERDLLRKQVEETERYEERWRGGRWREEHLCRKGLPSAEGTGTAPGMREPRGSEGGSGGGRGLTNSGRHGGDGYELSPGGGSQITPGGTRRDLVELVDHLVETGAMEDALCAVCAGGESEEPNEILFCERCEARAYSHSSTFQLNLSRFCRFQIAPTLPSVSLKPAYTLS